MPVNSALPDSQLRSQCCVVTHTLGRCHTGSKECTRLPQQNVRFACWHGCCWCVLSSDSCRALSWLPVPACLPGCCSPVPVGTVPIYEALERAGGSVEGITWELFKQVLLDQAEQVGGLWVGRGAAVKQVEQVDALWVGPTLCR